MLCGYGIFELPAEKPFDPEVEKKIDIGFPQLSTGSKSEMRKERMSYVKTQRQSSDLEKQARTQTRNLRPQCIVQLFLTSH